MENGNDTGGPSPDFNSVAPPTPEPDPTPPPSDVEASPVSKMELDALEAQRETPRAELNFDPPASVTQSIDAEAARQREGRIAHIRERLGAHDDMARDGFNQDAGARER